MAMTFNEDRKTGLGGSDMPIILGVSPFGKTPEDIWREKLGLTVQTESTAPMKRGTRLEPVAIEEYSGSTGRRIASGRELYRDPACDFMIAHIDGKIMDDDGQWSGILEVKIPNVSTYLRYKREGLADYIQIQLQHYLAVTKKMWGSIYIWSPEMWDGFAIEAKQEPEIIDLIYAKADQFWHYVKTETPPPSLAPVNLPEMPKHDGAIVKVDSPEWAAAAREYRMATELLDEAERIKERSKARILELMAGLDAAEGHGLRVYNKWSEGRRTVDKKAAVAEILRLRKLVTDLDPKRVFTEDPEKLITKQGKPFTTTKTYFVGNFQQLEG